MIDAHVQYNGGWKGYGSLQPGLQCEFEDHRTCKELSARLQAEQDAQTEEAKKILEDKLKAQVDERAIFAAEQEKQAELNKSGQKKHEAVRTINKDAADHLAKLEEAAANELGRISAKAVADTEEVTKRLAIEIEKINATRAAKLAAVEAVDWLSEVRKEAAGA